MGAESIKELLAELDLDQLSKELTAELREASGQKRLRIIKRLELWNPSVCRTTARSG